MLKYICGNLRKEQKFNKIQHACIPEIKFRDQDIIYFLYFVSLSHGNDNG